MATAWDEVARNYGLGKEPLGTGILGGIWAEVSHVSVDWEEVRDKKTATAGKGWNLDPWGGPWSSHEGEGYIKTYGLGRQPLGESPLGGLWDEVSFD